MSPEKPSPDKPEGRGSGLRWSAWNLLLFVPLLMLITPLFNADGPRLFGLPFFYWYQFAWIVVGVLCTYVVYKMTGRGDRR